MVVLFLQKRHNKTLDSWVTDELFEKIWDLKMLEFKLYFYTKKMTKYQTGLYILRYVTIWCGPWDQLRMQNILFYCRQVAFGEMLLNLIESFIWSSYLWSSHMTASC